jgi:hypothetical protein
LKSPMGRPLTARGPAADDDPPAWAHRVSIKRMSPAQESKFSRGPGPWVKVYFDRTLILKILALKLTIGKILNTVAAHI